MWIIPFKRIEEGKDRMTESLSLSTYSKSSWTGGREYGGKRGKKEGKERGQGRESREGRKEEGKKKKK